MYGDNSIKYTGTEADACGIFTGTSNIVGIEDSTNQPPTLSIDMNGNGISAIKTKNSDTQYINFKNINLTVKNSENGIYLDGYSWYTALGFNFDNSSVPFENVNSAINLNNLGFVDFKSTNSKFDFGNSSNIIAGDKSLMTGKILSDKNPDILSEMLMELYGLIQNLMPVHIIMMEQHFLQFLKNNN